MTKTILFLSAARSEYDLLVPVMRACREYAGLRVQLLVSAAHLSPFHGLGIEQIRADGFEIVAELETLVASESWVGRSLSFANLVEGLSRHLPTLDPDLLFVAGDREEALAAAVVANLLRIPLAHLYGGDRCIASDVDEVFRPAISKMAHLHFTACEAHTQRLVRMGERPEYVWTVGATGLDRFRDQEELSADQIRTGDDIDPEEPFFLLIHHPVPTMETDGEYEEMIQILDGLLSLGHPVFCSRPNYDPGNLGIRQAIDEMTERHAKLIVYDNLPRADFVALYRRCSAIVGNSSSIVLESAFVGVPGILIGPRQDLRERGDNVIRVDARREAVTAACERALYDDAFRQQAKTAHSPFGEGRAGRRVAELLAMQHLGTDLMMKTMTY